MTDSAFQEFEGWSVYRLPRSHWHCGLQEFRWGEVKPKALQPNIVQFLQQVVDGQSPHLLLTGAPGIGKSHIGVGVYRALAAKLGTQVVTWLNVPAFCEEVKRHYGADFDPWDDYNEAIRLVVLDDLFGKELTAHEKDQIVTRLVDTAYRNNAAVLMTMNQDVDELARRLPAHEISRVLADCTVIPMSAMKDQRR